MRNNRGGLEGADVQVWFVELTAGRAAIEDYWRILSSDERERAGRFRFPHLKTAFTLSRGTLRILTAGYLNVEPDQIHFGYSERGKPHVARPLTTVRFNLAHSGAFACYAFAAGCEVGVDIEQIRPVREQEQIVRRFFSPEECNDWMELADSERDEAFFRCWTRKEAYIKAVGDGLAIPLDSFRVSLRPDAPAALLQVRPDSGGWRDWALHSISPAAGYAGALMVPEGWRKLRVHSPVTAEAILQQRSG